MQAAGRSVWSTPEILTWEAWLSRQWRAAVQRGAAPAARLLSLSQERALWEEMLRPDSLGLHAPALQRAAARATQSLLSLARSAVTDEEQLLARTLARVRATCEARGLLSLSLAAPEHLRFLADIPAPAIVGQPHLTPLQQRLGELYWPQATLLLACTEREPVAPVLRRETQLEDEIAACAEWCRAHLQADPARRLLVISACGDPSLRTQESLLWRELTGACGGQEPQRERWLAVEGGEPLRGQALIADAIELLAVTRGEFETTALRTLLHSPYLDWGSTAQCVVLDRWLAERSLARWPLPKLERALEEAPGAAASRLAAWLADSAPLRDRHARRSGTEWARLFAASLEAARFAAGTLDSRDAQRLQRWHGLLDELAGLDAVLEPLSAEEALNQLQRLALQVQHQAASGDAAITLSANLADPVARYDGIWVLGLSENRWPAPPRPDPYVPHAEQRRTRWSEASVALRRAQALWALDCWRRRTDELVLSHAAREADLPLRPTPLVPAPQGQWPEVPRPPRAWPPPLSIVETDAAFGPLTPPESGRPLRGGAERLRVQQACAFRAQAQWRLDAMPPPQFTDGITPALRGSLLHALLQELWGELGDSARLQTLSAAEQDALLERHWQRALRDPSAAATRWLPERVMRRERSRTLDIVARVLELERQRPAFRVTQREREVYWQGEGARLRLRIDRVDEVAGFGALVVDYKTGTTGPVRLHEAELEPLQLALYVAALAAEGQVVQGAVLLGLKPGDLGWKGVAAAEGALPAKLKQADPWTQAREQWQAQLLQLMAAHLSGVAPLADSPAACRHCHLAVLCRRAAITDGATEAESGDE